MKLIDLLVQDALNGEHKWPEGAKFATQDEDCSVYTYVGEPVFDCGEWVDEADNNPAFFSRVGVIERADDFEICVITREQYEAALAAAQHPVWNGDGLPPVGCECELSNVVEFYTHSGSTDFDEGTTVVVGGTVNFGLGDFVAVKVKGTNCITDINPCFLRPIRSEADKKRDAAIKAIIDDMRTIPCDLDLRDEVAVIYDAIAAGKVPGMKIF